MFQLQGSLTPWLPNQGICCLHIAGFTDLLSSPIEIHDQWPLGFWVELLVKDLIFKCYYGKDLFSVGCAVIQSVCSIPGGIWLWQYDIDGCFAARYVFRQKLRCQQSRQNKAKSAAVNSRSTDCPAVVHVKIKHVNRHTQKNDSYLRWACIIFVQNGSNTHSLQTAQSSKNAFGAKLSYVEFQRLSIKWPWHYSISNA